MATARPEQEEKMTVSYVNQCAYCRSAIAPGQRWVREKIYEPAPNRDPNYHRFHAEPFAGDGASCWEKQQLEREIARTNPYAA